MQCRHAAAYFAWPMRLQGDVVFCDEMAEQSTDMIRVLRTEWHFPLAPVVVPACHWLHCEI